MKCFSASTGNGARTLKTIVFFLILIFLLLGSFALYFFNYYAVFQVRDYNSDEVIFSKYLRVGEAFTLEFTHSVTKRPVYEVYYVKDRDTLALKEMRFDAYGPNLPAGPEKMGSETTEFIIEDGSYRVLFQNRTFDSIILRTGSVIANHTLVFEDGSRVPFLDVTPGGTLVVYHVRPITRSAS